MDGTPPDPVTLDASAVMQHETFISWVRAGFTREEALDLLKVYLATGMAMAMAPPQDRHGDSP